VNSAALVKITQASKQMGTKSFIWTVKVAKEKKESWHRGEVG
jgi:hypothetical protein